MGPFLHYPKLSEERFTARPSGHAKSMGRQNLYRTLATQKHAEEQTLTVPPEARSTLYRSLQKLPKLEDGVEATCVTRDGLLAAQLDRNHALLLECSHRYTLERLQKHAEQQESKVEPFRV